VRKRIILLLTLQFLVIIFLDLGAQQPNPAAVQQQNKNTTAAELQFLKDEITQYRDFIQQEREQHQQFLESYYEKTLYLFYIIGCVIVFLITSFGITSIWQIKRSVHRLFDKYTVSLLTKENESLKQYIDDLKKVVDHETRYLKKRIVLLCTADDQHKLEQQELPMIYARGIRSENLKIYNQITDVMQAVKNNTIDLLLYYYNPDEQKTDATLHKLIDQLKRNDKPIPIIVYNFDKPNERGQLFSKDSEAMRSYPYHLAANFPITFVNHIYTTINYFSM